MGSGGSLPHSQEPSNCLCPEPAQSSPRSPPHFFKIKFLSICFVTSCFFYGEELLATRPIPKLEYHPSSAVRDCLFSTFAATLHNWRPFLYPQHQDAPCRGDRDPLNTVWLFYSQSKQITLELRNRTFSAMHSCTVNMKI
jgi:hypothetical protein